MANFIRSGDPNSDGLPEWPRAGAEPNFIRFADGYAYPVETTLYPNRDAINRRDILKRFKLDEVAVSGD